MEEAKLITPERVIPSFDFSAKFCIIGVLYYRISITKIFKGQ